MRERRRGELGSIKSRIVLKNRVDFRTSGIVGFEKRQILSWMALVLTEGTPVRDKALDNVTAVPEELQLSDMRSHLPDLRHRLRQYHCTLSSTLVGDRGEPAPR